MLYSPYGEIICYIENIVKRFYISIVLNTDFFQFPQKKTCLRIEKCESGDSRMTLLMSCISLQIGNDKFRNYERIVYETSTLKPISLSKYLIHPT